MIFWRWSLPFSCPTRNHTADGLLPEISSLWLNKLDIILGPTNISHFGAVDQHPTILRLDSTVGHVET